MQSGIKKKWRSPRAFLLQEQSESSTRGVGRKLLHQAFSSRLEVPPRRGNMRERQFRKEKKNQKNHLPIFLSYLPPPGAAAGWLGWAGLGWPGLARQNWRSAHPDNGGERPWQRPGSATRASGVAERAAGNYFPAPGIGLVKPSGECCRLPRQSGPFPSRVAAATRRREPPRHSGRPGR